MTISPPADAGPVPAVPLAPASDLGPIPTPTPHWPGRRVTSGGVTLHVRETPGPDAAAPTAVFVHGLGGSATNWTELAAGLAGRMHGIALDLPGFGRSDPPAGDDYSVAAHADAVLRFLAGRGERVHLLGNSLGGAVALTVAARRPELVRTLTLVSPAMPDLRPDPGRLGDPRMALALLPLVGARVRAELAGEEPRERLARTMRLCYADPGQVSAATFDLAAGEAAERAALPWAATALHRSFAGLVTTWLTPRSGSLWATAARVPVPTLVVWGERDRLVSVRKARRTTRAIPAARLLRLPDVGHVAQMERPALVARAVLGLVDAAAADTWSGPDTRPCAAGRVGPSRA